jgi:hypothetical protein
MSRYARRKDEVHPAIVADLREGGAKVEILDVSKGGVPDLLVGWLGTLHLLELKSPGGKPDAEQLHEHDEWARVGVKVSVVKTPREARAAIGMGCGERYAENLKAMAALGRKA